MAANCKSTTKKYLGRKNLHFQESLYSNIQMPGFQEKQGKTKQNEG